MNVLPDTLNTLIQQNIDSQGCIVLSGSLLCLFLQGGEVQLDPLAAKLAALDCLCTGGHNLTLE